MHLTHLISIVRSAVPMLDRGEPAPFSRIDLYRACDQGDLVGLFERHLGVEGFISLWATNPKSRAAAEEALGEATRALRGHEAEKTGVHENPLCLTIAIVTEAIEKNFG